MSILTLSEWDYDTSEDHSASVFLFSGGYGTIYLKNVGQKLRMAIPYRYGNVGESKGVDLGFSWADASYIGMGTFFTFDAHYFSDLDLPCNGFVGSVGISAGAGVNASLWLFGLAPPFALLKTGGGMMSVGGGVGIGVGPAHFGSPTITTLYVDDGDS
jgi:hypothetical protein